MLDTNKKQSDEVPLALTNTFQMNRRGPLMETSVFDDTKDPCPVYDGEKWHIFGSGGSSKIEKWQILHATAPTLEGPWKEEAPAIVPINNPHVAAPGVIFDDKEHVFHMFVQTDFLSLNGTVEHLISFDGYTFQHIGTVLSAIHGSNEACIYDPHPAVIKGELYLTYSGAPAVGRPDIYLAKSATNSWYGPWQRLGKILSHEQVPHHNQHNHPDYEWGLEGSQLIELSNGRVLMNAVCFLPNGPRGTRQRIFFAIAESIEKPFKTLGPIMQPSIGGWDSGENGHATAIFHGGNFHLFYQARPFIQEKYNPWRYGVASCPIEALSQIQSLMN